jgi:hypothetical protein
MARNGSGTYSLPQPPFVTNTTINSTATNSNNSDMAAALTQSISKDGQTAYTGNQPMGGNKLTGLGLGTAVADSAAMSQLYGVPTYGGVGGGTADAITITPSPGITVYAIGQKFSFKASGANTGAVTLNVNSVGAGAVVWPYGTALVAGDIPANGMVEVEVQATTPVFHLQTPKAPQTVINQSSTGPTFQEFASGTAATYTTPANVKWIKVRAIGGGGGGGGGGASTRPTGATGGTTTFNSVNAVGGSGGAGGATVANAGGAGGTGGTGTANVRIPGAAGSGCVQSSGVSSGGAGGNGVFGGGAGAATTTGTITSNAGATNTGGGGSGTTGDLTNSVASAGGGAGEYFELIIINPSATYTYTVGAGGAGGIGTGTGAGTGGAGAAGRIIVEENYNY